MTRIVVRDGVFNVGDVVATAMLKICFNIEEIIRTSDEGIISKYKNDKETFVIGVGAEYNTIYENYDYHQVNFKFYHRKTNIPFSSAGLIWYNYAYAVIVKVLPKTAEYDEKFIYNKMYDDIISIVDAHENNDSEARYSILCNNKNAIDIVGIISNFIPVLGDDIGIETKKQIEDKAFNKAVNECMSVITRYIWREYMNFQVKEYVRDKIKKASKEDKILILDKLVPWREVIEKEKNHDFKVVIYPSISGKEYLAECVRSPNGGYKFLFPSYLAEQPKEVLVEMTGYKSIEFVEKTGFLAISTDKEELIEFVKNLV
jgi:uncharacterized UPF0160 family protein